MAVVSAFFLITAAGIHGHQWTVSILTLPIVQTAGFRINEA